MTIEKRVCIVDDDKIFAFLTKKAIEQTNLFNEIIIFGNGLDAINFFKENINDQKLLPEIVLLDLNMPIMDGWQFLDEFILLQPNLTNKTLIYVVSSSISDEDINKAKSITGVSDFIVKPLSKEKILNIIKSSESLR